MAQGDAVDTYLGDIGRHELLTKEEEVRLGQAIESGRAASQELEREDGRLPPERRCHLRGLIRECERSTRQFIVANLRLVVSIAKRFRWSGVPLPDLIQEGNIGLIEAVRRFDHRRGFRFSTYAAIWIRKAIGRGIATTGRTIRLPVHVQERLTAVRRAQAKLAAERGRTPTLSELAIELRLPERTVVELTRCDPGGRHSAGRDRPGRAVGPRLRGRGGLTRPLGRRTPSGRARRPGSGSVVPALRAHRRAAAHHHPGGRTARGEQ